MMWKREKACKSMRPMNMEEKSPAGMKKRMIVKRKKLSGRIYLKHFRNLNCKEAKNIWKHLPYESKVMWNQRGNPDFVKIDNSQKSFSMKLNGEEDRLSNILMRRIGQ